jgi:hypothetical protein
MDYKDDPSGVAGYKELQVQLPRTQDYSYYLYRSRVDGKIDVVYEDQLIEVDPTDDTNPTLPPSLYDAQTFVVLNVTPDQDVDSVDFTSGLEVASISGGPKKKDQQMLRLSTGQYFVKAFYTKNSTAKETIEKTAIVTMEPGSMAVRTNFLYFYKTGDGNYQLTQYWPPNPNDAADDNKPEDALTDTQGILEISNDATYSPGSVDSVIARININGVSYPSIDNIGVYMSPNAKERFIVDAGAAYVAFMAKRDVVANMEWGMTVPVNILAKKVNYLSYTNPLAQPDALPPDTDGFGRGLIRITNNSSGVVTSVYVYDKDDSSKSIPIGYEGFTPPSFINQGQVGRVLVVGDAGFPLEAAKFQIVQVFVETLDSIRVVEKLVSLHNNIINIVITQEDLNNSKLPGSKVTIQNDATFPVIITEIMVYNESDPAVSMVYRDLDIGSGTTKTINVLSSPGFPILEGHTYKATLAVQGNGITVLIPKDFTPDKKLYSLPPTYQTRYLTLINSELPPGLTTFTPINDTDGLVFSPSPLSVNSYVEHDGQANTDTLKTGGYLNLRSYLGINPANASKQGPIEWKLESNGNANGAVSFDEATGVLVVTGYSTALPSPFVDITATIRQAGGTINAKTDVSKKVTVNLTYTVTQKPYSVTNFSVTNANVSALGYLDLGSLVGSWTPSYANNGVSPITPSNLTWAITGIDYGSTIVGGSVFRAGDPGSSEMVTVQATLPSGSNNSYAGGNIVRMGIITITYPAATFKPVTNITVKSGGSPALSYYTYYDSGNTKRLDTGLTAPLNLTGLVDILPVDADVRFPVEWVATGGAAQYNVIINSPAYNLEINPSSLPVSSPAIVQVTPTIRNAGTSGTDFTGLGINVTLTEINSRPVWSGQLTAADKTITVDEIFDMNTQVTLPAGATQYGVPITKSDLTWTVVNNTYGELNASGSVKGKAAGTFMVTVTLPANKNAGAPAISATATVTVVAKPHPDYLTLRVFHVNSKSDRLLYIATVPGNRGTLNPSVFTTGYSGLCFTLDADNSYLSNFKKRYPYAAYYGLGSSGLYYEWEYADVTLPWPTTSDGYCVFFVEKDSRVRGYSVSGKVAPARADNYYFYLDAETVKNFIIPMVGVTESAAGASGSKLVIPIGYNTHTNASAILKSTGVGNTPWVSWW